MVLHKKQNSQFASTKQTFLPHKYSHKSHFMFQPTTSKQVSKEYSVHSIGVTLPHIDSFDSPQESHLYLYNTAKQHSFTELYVTPHTQEEDLWILLTDTFIKLDLDQVNISTFFVDAEYPQKLFTLPEGSKKVVFEEEYEKDEAVDVVVEGKTTSTAYDYFYGGNIKSDPVGINKYNTLAEYIRSTDTELYSFGELFKLAKPVYQKIDMPGNVCVETYLTRGVYKKRIRQVSDIKKCYSHIYYRGVDKKGNPVEKPFFDDYFDHPSMKGQTHSDIDTYPIGHGPFAKTHNPCPNDIVNLWIHFHVPTIPMPAKKSQVIKDITPPPQIPTEYVFPVVDDDEHVKKYKDSTDPSLFDLEPLPDDSDATLALKFIKSFIFDLFDRNQNHYLYFMSWVGHMIQFPETKSRSPALVGSQGIGKNLLLLLMRNLFDTDRVFESTNPSRDVFGQFNFLLINMLLVCINECSNRDISAHKEAFKAMATDEKGVYNKKHMDQVILKEFLRMMFLSNNTNIGTVLLAEEKQRRWWLVKLCAIHKGDSEYFNRVVSSINHMGAVRLLFEELAFIPHLHNFPQREPPYSAQQNHITKTFRDPTVSFLCDFFVTNPKHTITSSDPYHEEQNNGDLMYSKSKFYTLYKTYIEKNFPKFDSMNIQSFYDHIHNLNIPDFEIYIKGIKYTGCIRFNYESTQEFLTAKYLDGGDETDEDGEVSSPITSTVEVGFDEQVKILLRYIATKPQEVVLLFKNEFQRDIPCTMTPEKSISHLKFSPESRRLLYARIFNVPEIDIHKNNLTKIMKKFAEGSFTVCRSNTGESITFDVQKLNRILAPSIKRLRIQEEEEEEEEE